MNMFKKKSKAKGQDDALGALTVNDNPPIVKAHRALTRKKKKQDVEEAPSFDLSSALPDNKEFRTSLLMPNLSARFSMLREQDDPNSLIGKASDDSVLFPKRSSRMNLFNNNNLGDIAEVESIHSTFRPPFADDRTGSMSDGYASDDGGSMMSRSRPGEGNNLFGGRQKLYRINAGSAKNLTDGGMTRGKHMYESDVSMSAFQQMRQREKEQRELDERTDRSSFPTAESEDVDSARSPLTAFSQNRGTQSSTNSGPSNRRTSTAATSVVSDSPLPQQTSNSAINKVKEQDANSSGESLGFAPSPGFRKFRDEGTRSPYQLSQSRSAANLRENPSRQSPVPAIHNFRGMSPPLSATSQPLDFGLKDMGKAPVPPSRFQNASPTTQLYSDQDETLANNVRPNDRGKATAMGLFNKPSRNYDDAQFQQRQVQMHEGRNSPMSITTSRAGSRASPEPTRSGRQSYASINSSAPQDDSYAPQVPPIPDYPPSPVSNRRTSAASTGRQSISRPRTKSSASTREAAVQARVQSLIRKQNAELAALEANHLGPSRSADDSPASVSPEKGDTRSTYLETSDYSDDEENGAASSFQLPTKSIVSPKPPSLPLPVDIHPAFRDGIQDFDFGTAAETRRPSHPRNSNFSSTSKTRPSTDRSRQSEHESTLSVNDNELSVPGAGLGLSGLISKHLRHDSGRSSIYPPPSPAFPPGDSRGSVSSTARTVTESVKSDPFEFDNDRLAAPPSISQEQTRATPSMIMSQRAQQLLANATALRNAHANGTLEPQTRASDEDESENDVQDTPRLDSANHNRSESTETQREARRFDDELAERQRRIREGLKSVQERSRSRSPDDRGRGNGAHGFSLPRFPGRSNTGDKFETQPQSKAMKMLGMSSSRDTPSPRPGIEPFPMDGERSRNMSSRSGSRPPLLQDNEYANGRNTPNSGKPGSRYGSSNGYDRPPPPRSTTPSSKPSSRSRSNSAAADRSASRNKHITDSDRAMMPGAFPGSPFLHESPQNEYGQRSDSAAGNRGYERSGSSAAGHYSERPTYFNAKNLGAPVLPGDFTPRASPRPSPNPGESIFAQQMATPMSPGLSGLPSPNPTNGRTTPGGTGRTTPSRDRKRSVTKHMISEPTFVSSTSTVPLVHLPRDGGPPVDPMQAPPVPVMNPRRRGNTAGEASNSQYALRPGASPLPVMPESPQNAEFQLSSSQPTPQPRSRNKLRKSSSEGGNLAARARQQALVAEIAKEQERSPNVAVFPNRSATSLHVSQHNGGMF